MPKRRSQIKLLHCALVVLALAACQPTVDQRGNLPDKSKLAEIEPGVTTKEMVSQMLGTPSSVSTFSDRTWYYISRRTEQTAFFRPQGVGSPSGRRRLRRCRLVRDVQHLNLADSRLVDPSSRETPSA